MKEVKLSSLNESDRRIINKNKSWSEYPSGIIFNGFKEKEVKTSVGIIRCNYTRDYDPSDPLYDSYSIRYELIK
jgi:hypothetical protein